MVYSKYSMDLNYVTCRTSAHKIDRSDRMYCLYDTPLES